jgi:hypothetical protein
MPDWGVPVDESSTTTPAAAWGTPVDDGNTTNQSAALSAPQDSQSSEQIVQDQTGIKPFSNPIAQGAAGVARAVASPVTGAYQAVKNAFTDPNISTPEEQAAQDQWGSLGLGVQRAFVEPAEKAHQTATDLRSQGHPILAAGAELGALPVIGPMGQAMGARMAAGDIPGALTEGATSALMPSAMKEIPGQIGAAKQVIRPATSTAVVPAEEQAGAGLAKAINPPGGIPEGFEDALTNQTPGIKDYATRTGNPLNTRWELAKAALGHAQELNDFFDDHVLGPSADRRVPVDSSYQGTGADGKASLGDIDTRLSKINNLLRPAGNAATPGATMTALERSGLQDEANSLRTTLYNELSKDTGMDPDAIKKLRQDYGQSYDIAGRTDAARRRVTPGGGGIPTSKEGLIKSVLEGAVGGRDAIADRGVQSSLQQFKPAMSPIDQMRQGITGFKAQSAAAAATNQAAAQQEFLHGTNLTQGAQDAAAARAAQAGAVRQQAAKAGAGFTQTASPQAGTFASPKVPPGTVRYSGGKAYALDPKSGWWIPQS